MSVITEYRPKVFGDVIGQDSLVQKVSTACAVGIPPNAYLFTGIRGTGKTSVARIVAMSLNCESVDDNGDPCLECDPCKAVLRDMHPNVKEYDMASHRGINEVKELKKILKFVPVQDGVRVIILDEAHQITKDGASALLKVLEEPPENTLWILCTTDPQKLLPTIKSRCEKHDFKRVDPTDIEIKLGRICLAKKVDHEKGVLHTIAEAAGGSVRDAESLLSPYLTSEIITKEAVQELLSIEADFEALLKDIEHNDKISLLKYFRDNAVKVADEAWLSRFVDFLINVSIKQNSTSHANLLANLVQYMRYLTVSMPSAFVQLIFIRLADSYVEVQTADSIMIPVIYKLAAWFEVDVLLVEEDYTGTLEVANNHITYGKRYHCEDKQKIQWFIQTEKDAQAIMAVNAEKHTLKDLSKLGFIKEL